MEKINLNCSSNVFNNIIAISLKRHKHRRNHPMNHINYGTMILINFNVHFHGTHSAQTINAIKLTVRDDLKAFLK